MVFHWPPGAMDDMAVSELMEWREEARKRHNPEK
ncbi:GpE family phage tail protein [Iodobacter ciconiae]